MESALGDKVRALRAECFAPLPAAITPLERARDLLLALRERGHAMVFASSSKPEHVDHYINLRDARLIIDSWTTTAGEPRERPTGRPMR